LFLINFLHNFVGIRQGQIKLFNEDQLTNGNLVVFWMDFYNTNNTKIKKFYLTPFIYTLICFQQLF